LRNMDDPDRYLEDWQAVKQFLGVGPRPRLLACLREQIGNSSERQHGVADLFLECSCALGWNTADGNASDQPVHEGHLVIESAFCCR
jgi:hypothetical protein